ncbi:vomeronasal type-2 receptor 26-like [Pyxicephalus adspersus]|uniref:vomeronasal type-2 receptor 26-like n=1 Tax=Pyxicephalus adspersus TaxID=30357 RepID=UPI003B5ADE72
MSFTIAFKSSDLPMRLSKVLVFLALITVVQESTQSRCLLEKQNIESFWKDGDIIIGVITLIHSTIYQPYVTYQEKPEAATCEDFVIRYYRDVLAVIFAIEEINENRNILPNLTLGFDIFDSCVSEARAIQATMMLLWEEKDLAYDRIGSWKIPILAGIVGDSMSTLSIPIARIAGLCNYPQISFGAFDPDLGDRIQFPSFLRTVPNENIQNKAISQLLKHLGWTWVGILTRDDDLGALDGQNLKDEIISNQGCVAFLEKIHFRYTPEKLRKILNVVMNATAVAVVVYCEEMHVKPLLDMMSENGKKGKIWIYTLSFTFIPEMFSESNARLLNGSIGLVLHSEPMPQFGQYLRHLHPSKYADDIFIKPFWEIAFECKWCSNGDFANDSNSISPCKGDESLNEVDTLFELGDLSYTFQAYIAVHAFAYALHNLLHCTNQTFPSGSCNEENLLPWKVFQHLKNVHFKTQSGDKVFFNDIGEVPAMFDIMNLQIYPNNEYRLVKVGRYDSRESLDEQVTLDTSSVIWNQEYEQMPRSVCSEMCESGHRKVSVKDRPICCFQCVPCSLGEITNDTEATACVKCPDDQWPNEKQDSCLMKMIEFLSYEDTMGISLAVASVTFSMTSISVVCIFRKYSETPVVKANNRNISYVILVGLIVCFLSTLFFIGFPDPIMCYIRQIIFGITFSVVVSGMLAKTITVILIFQSTRPGSIGKRFDSKISNVVIYFCPLFQLVICAVWVGTSPPYPELNMTSKADIIIAECNEGSNLFFYCMLGYMGFLATISFIVAFLSRKLPDSFNEGQYITFSMFAFLSVWICFIPAYLSAEGKNIVIVEIFAILASSAGLLVCLFFPKCYIILFHPEMNTKQYVRGKM